MATLKMQQSQIWRPKRARPRWPCRAQARTSSKSVQIAHLLITILAASLFLMTAARGEAAHEPDRHQEPAGSNSTLRLPLAARCQLARPAPRPIKSPSYFDKLAPLLGSNTAVKMMQTQVRHDPQQAPGGHSPANRQLVFESICDGWTNNITYGLVTHRKPTAFWVYDPSRAALVAKMVFYEKQELLEIVDRQARLLSPLFRPIPAYHSMPESKYYTSCHFTYSSYFTIPGHLELALLLKTSSSAPPERIILKQEFKGKLVQKQQNHESDYWQAKELSLPQNLPLKFPYRIEFSAILSPPSSAMFHDQDIMNSIAIANMSLSPRCFGLDVDEDELSRLRKLTGREPLSVWREEEQNEAASSLKIMDLLEKHQLWIIFVIGLLLLLIILSQFMLCSSYIERSQRGVFGVQPITFSCCCLSLPLGQSSRRKRGRVYAANQQESHNEPKPGQNGSLMPLRYILGSDRLELVENQNYQSSLSEVNRLALIERALYDSLHRYHIDRNRLTLTQQLGKGAFGQVYQGYLVCDSDSNSTDGAGSNETSANSLSNSSSHSIKVAVKTYTDEKISRLDFMREASNMAATRHRNIVQLLGVCFEDKPLYIVMELCQGGNLKDFLLRNRDRDTLGRPSRCFSYYNAVSSGSQAAYEPVASLSPDLRRASVSLSMGDLLVFALDVARACRYLQLHQFIHRDLATRNCLLTSNVRAGAALSSAPELDQQAVAEIGSLSSCCDAESLLSQVYLNGFRNSSMVVKLADFGMTRDVLTAEYYRSAHKEMPVRWMPPESLDGVATINSDVWSFGVLLWELFSMGQMPYQHLPDNHKVIEFIRLRRHTRPASEQPEAEQLMTANQTGSGQVSPVKVAAVAPQPAPPVEPAAAAAAADATTELLLTISDENVSSAHQYADQVCLLSGAKLVSLDSQDSSGATTLERDHEAGYKRADGLGAPDAPPLPKPHDNTPDPIYAIMCSCWANEPENRPNFEQVCLRLYECLQMSQVLDAELPHFYDS